MEVVRILCYGKKDTLCLHPHTHTMVSSRVTCGRRKLASGISNKHVCATLSHQNETWWMRSVFVCVHACFRTPLLLNKTNVRVNESNAIFIFHIDELNWNNFILRFSILLLRTHTHSHTCRPDAETRMIRALSARMSIRDAFFLSKQITVEVPYLPPLHRSENSPAKWKWSETDSNARRWNHFVFTFHLKCFRRVATWKSWFDFPFTTWSFRWKIAHFAIHSLFSAFHFLTSHYMEIARFN